jgi:hypothetical protein
MHNNVSVFVEFHLSSTKSRTTGPRPKIETAKSTFGTLLPDAIWLGLFPAKPRIGSRISGDSAPRDPTRFRTIQVCPKDLPVCLWQAEGAEA